jgi:hypothetical protein
VYVSRCAASRIPILVSELEPYASSGGNFPHRLSHLSLRPRRLVLSPITSSASLRKALLVVWRTLRTFVQVTAMLLTSRIVRTARPREHRYVLADEHGMSLHVMPRGSKWWRFRYRFWHTEKMISLGVYPDVDLATARRWHADARGLLVRDIDERLSSRRPLSIELRCSDCYLEGQVENGISTSEGTQTDARPAGNTDLAHELRRRATPRIHC